MDIDICTMICQCIFTIPLPSPRVNLFNPPVKIRHHNHIYTDISPWKRAPFFDFTYPKEALWLKSPHPRTEKKVKREKFNFTTTTDNGHSSIREADLSLWFR